MRATFLALCACGLVAIGVSSAIAGGQVHVELATEEGFPAVETQRWFRLITDMKVAGLTIRASRAQDEPAITVAGKGPDAVYRVTGILTAGNELLLPGGRFAPRDARRIAAWFEKLKTDGPATGPVAARPFGLTVEDLAKAHDVLSTPVDFSTVGMPAAEALSAMAEKLDLPLSIGADAEAALAATDPVADELKGLSAGTALAALLRPAGVGLAPRRPKESVELLVFVPGEKELVWPIGYAVEGGPREVLPKALEFLDVDIVDVPLPTVLAALGERLDAPLLFDRNALAEREIDLDGVKVSLPIKKMMYIRALRGALSKARLTDELRVDEANKPFFWITAPRPAR